MNQEISNENTKHRSGSNNRRNKLKKKKTRMMSSEIAICQALQNICGAYYKVIKFFISTLFVISLIFQLARLLFIYIKNLFIFFPVVVTYAAVRKM